MRPPRARRPFAHDAPGDGLGPMVAAWVAKQPWAGRGTPKVQSVDALAAGEPAILHAVVAVGADTWSVLVGRRPLGAAEAMPGGQEGAVIGTDGDDLLYDALVDDALVLSIVSEVLDLPVKEQRIRRLSSLEVPTPQVAIDERWRLYAFRKLFARNRPSVELFLALDEAGFNHVAAPVSVWRTETGRELGFCTELLQRGTDGVVLVQTSLRDLFGSGGMPEAAGGDFATESSRMGEVLGRMHAVLAEVFGAVPGEPSGWAETAERRAGRVGSKAWRSARAKADLMRKLAEPGRSIRVHANLDLAAMIRTDLGWYVEDVSDAPEPRWASPLADVAQLIRSFRKVAGSVVAEQHRADAKRSGVLARAWFARNRQALLEGYLSVADSGGLLPSREGCEVVLDAFGAGAEG